VHSPSNINRLDGVLNVLEWLSMVDLFST